MHFPYLIYKDKNSRDFGLYITAKSRYSGPARDLTFTAVPGRSGELVTDGGRFKDLTVTYTLALLNTETRPFAGLTRAIKAWLLAEPGCFPLWDSYDEEYFRLACLNGEVNITQELRDLGTLTLNFHCKPFQYSALGQTPVTMKAPGSLYNPESFPAAPYLKLTGEGDVTLHIGPHTLFLRGVEGYLELDLALPNAYKGTAPKNHTVSGAALDAVRLTPGENPISWSGGVKFLEIIPRWCCL